MKRRRPTAYIVIVPMLSRFDLSVNRTAEYSWDGASFKSRTEAVDHGIEKRGYLSDFGIGEIYCGALLGFSWMYRDLKYDLAEIAAQIGLKVCI